MMDEHKGGEEKLDALLQDLARDYNAPPATPKAELWERITAARQATGTAELTRHPGRARFGQGLRWGLALAALLLLGIAIGRITAPGSPGSTPVPGPREIAASGSPTDSAPVRPETAPRARVPGVTPAAEGRDRAGAGAGEVSDIAVQLVMAQHLGRIETLLTDFDTQRAAAEFSGQADELLGTTRLLLDSKRVTDVGTRRLLEDLELILVQLAALSADRSEDRAFIADGLAQRQLRTRLRNAIPAGSVIRM